MRRKMTQMILHAQTIEVLTYGKWVVFNVNVE